MTIADRTRSSCLILALLLLASWTSATVAHSVPLAPALTAQPATGPAAGADRLASILLRRARSATQVPQPTLQALDLARRLTRLAVDLDPERPSVLRTALTVAEITEDAVLRDELIARLARLDPDDQVIRLSRLRSAMERYQTAADRIAAYERLLQDANIEKLGRPEASRLAIDLANLKQRVGDMPGFAEWLGRSTALDQAHKEAAGLAAGYFRIHVDDPFAEAELLVNLLMADPTDEVSHAALARHLLDHGAYDGAARLYALGAEGRESVNELTAPGLVADRAIALWGAGRRDAAEEVLRDRQRYYDERARQAARQQQPDLTATERRMMVRGAPPPAMNTVGIAIADRKVDTTVKADRLATLMESLRLSYEAILEAEQKAAETGGNPPAVELKVENFLQRAMHLYWFGTSENVTAARGFVQQANDLKALNERAMTRFEGLARLREGDPEGALELLEPIMAEDVPARVGAAIAYEELGRKRDAAAAFLDVARGAAGTVVGVWAKDRLEALLGQPLPPGDLAVRLNRLISQLPAHIDRFVTDPAALVAMRIEPVSEAFKPYEPILIRIELTNRAVYPIEIGPDCAIKSRLIIEPSVTMIGMTSVDQTTPIVVSLHRRLRLMPRERLTIDVDLRQYPVADLFDQHVIRGASINLKGTTNFTITQFATIQPGVGGVVNRSSLVRVDGVRISATWIENALIQIEEAGAGANLTTLGILARTLWLSRGQETPESTSLYDRTRRTVIEVFGQLPPEAQAWLLSTMPATQPELESIRQIARTIDHKLVRICYLLHHVSESTDPMLDAAARSSDDDVRALGTLIREMLVATERQRDDLN